MSKFVSIAIIGAGASGTLTALNLLQKLNQPASIYLIEKRKEAAYRGSAYSSQLDYEPLNVQAGRMSAFNHLPDDFFDWLKRNKQTTTDTEITRDSFVSRRWYGDYLTETITHASQQAGQIEFKTIIDEASQIDFDAENDTYQIALNSGKTIFANYLIFATGNEAPADVFKPNEIARLNGHYVSNPWAANPLSKINEHDDVLIVGTGLTMVDHVVSLHKRGHKGKIFCFSRNGYLPRPHTGTVQNFVFEFDDDQKQLTDILSAIRKNVDVAGEKNVPWQNAIDAMRGKTSQIWKRMDIGSKRNFLTRVRSFWEIHRHRMPMASADVLNELLASGQLEILSGVAKSVGADGENAVFKFTPKGSKQERSITVKKVINCTGPAGDYFKTSNTLFKNLLVKGWMKQDELKLGIVTGARGEIIQANGVVLQNAFSIGPLRRATEWETTAIREIRTQAEETAIFISSQVELKPVVLV